MKHLLYICILFMACTSSTEYKIAITALPDRINPADAKSNYKLYVLRQLHEPLFVYSIKSKVRSNVLDSWSANEEYNKYKFCVKKDILFSNGKGLTSNVLKENLLYFDQTGLLYRRIKKIATDTSCVYLEFDYSYPRLLDDLMAYSTAIVDTSTLDDRIVVGISKYNVKEINSDIIHLSSKTSKRFKDIYFYKWKSDLGISLCDYDDINYVASIYKDKYKDKLSDCMNVYNVPLLRTVVLLINHSDINVRRFLFNCLDINEIRKIMFPDKERFNDVGGILPVGLPGAMFKMPKQICQKGRFIKKENVDFIHYSSDEINNHLNDYLSQFNHIYNINIEAKNVAPMVANSRGIGFDLAVIAVDASVPQSIEYFKYFVDGDMLITKVKNSYLNELVASYYKITNESEANKILLKANKLLLENYQVLPLYQIEMPFYFSKKIKKINSDDLFMGMPNISEME